MFKLVRSRTDIQTWHWDNKKCSLGTDGLAKQAPPRNTRDQEIPTLAHQMMLVDFASSARPTQTQKDAFVLHALESSTSEEVDMDFAIRAGNILQTLAFLSHVIRAKADDPGKVRKYANLAEEELQTLGELMRPMLWNPK